MGRSFVTLLLAALALSACATAPLHRALIWNVGDAHYQQQTHYQARTEDPIAYLKRIGIDEVHLWLNDNGGTLPCTTLFSYREGDLDGPLFWDDASLYDFSRRLRQNHIRIVYMVSPRVFTAAYIHSLSEGPFAVARRIGDVTIIFDLEGNGDNTRCTAAEGRRGFVALHHQAADEALIAAVRAAHAHLAVTADHDRALLHHYLVDHADAIMPQLYDQQHGFDLSHTQSALAFFDEGWPRTPIWIGLSLQCASAFDGHHHVQCSKDWIDDEVAWIEGLHSEHPRRYPGYVFWAEYDAQQCRPREEERCSAFGSTYLNRRGGMHRRQ